MKRADALIIGAGVMGASIAYHLASSGVTGIMVVDREPESGRGSTGKATGGFRAQFGTEVNVRLSLMSREKLLRFRDETGVDPGYEARGYLFLARSGEELATLRAANELQRRCGLLEARIVDAAEARSLNPAVHDDSIRGAAFCPTDGFIRPLQILRGYTEAAKRLGVVFQFGEQVRAIRPDAAGILINAAGAWASQISSVPVQPLRRRVAATIPTNVLPSEMPMTIWVADGFHLRVRDGRVLLLWPDDPPDDATWMEEVLRRTHERLPVLRDIPIDPQHCWEGLYEMSPDHHVILGRDPHQENLYLATGSSGHGVMHAPATGQLLSEIILGRRTSIDVRALRPQRFSEGDLVPGPSLL